MKLQITSFLLLWSFAQCKSRTTLGIIKPKHVAAERRIVGGTTQAAQDALDSAMAIWAGHGLARYSFAYQQHCFCDDEAYRQQPLMVQVQDATVISVANRFGDSVLDLVADFVSSIESIFFTIQEAIDIHADEINVAYNEEYGYPTSLYIDYDYWTADEELSIALAYLGPITEWQSDLDNGRSTWEEHGLVTYNYFYDHSTHNFGAESVAPKLVEVVDGVIVAVDGEPVQANDGVPTIEGLFDAIQGAISDSGAFEVLVEYDEEFGYPSSIRIDYEELLAAEKLIISATLQTGTLGAGGSVSVFSSDCQDDKNGTFLVDPDVGSFGCQKLSANLDQYDYLCEFLNVAMTCPKTCDTCQYYVGSKSESSSKANRNNDIQPRSDENVFGGGMSVWLHISLLILLGVVLLAAIIRVCFRTRHDKSDDSSCLEGNCTASFIRNARTSMLISPEAQRANLAPTFRRERTGEFAYPPKSVFNHPDPVTSGLAMIPDKDHSSSDDSYSDDEVEGAARRFFGKNKKEKDDDLLYGIRLSM